MTDQSPNQQNEILLHSEDNSNQEPASTPNLFYRFMSSLFSSTNDQPHDPAHTEASMISLKKKLVFASILVYFSRLVINGVLIIEMKNLQPGLIAAVFDLLALVMAILIVYLGRVWFGNKVLIVHLVVAIGTGFLAYRPIWQMGAFLLIDILELVFLFYIFKYKFGILPAYQRQMRQSL